MSSIGAPQQHKQSSRKGKKAWRKNVDITEVQDGLEELNDEIRLVGGPLSERKAEDLFALDIVGSKEIVKKYNLQKPLKADEILARRSAVPAIDGRKRPASDVPDGVYEVKKRRGDWVSKKEVRRLKGAINAVSHLRQDEETVSAVDLWDEPPVAELTQTLEYVPKKRSKVAPPTIKRAPVPLTANGKPVQAVRRPEEGTSYNPDYEQWEKLILKEGEKEIAAEKLRIAAQQHEAEKQARIEAAQADETAGRTDDESAWEGFETENEDMNVLRQKRPTRKTPTERNKSKKRKAAERLAKHEAKMAAKQVYVTQEDLDALNRSLVEKDDSAQQLTQKEDDGQEEVYGDDSKLRRRKMGNIHMPEKNLELVLPDELKESLRLLKPEGNLLQDRFRNLLVNGKVETKKPVLYAKKKRVKYTEKWSHKDFSIPV